MAEALALASSIIAVIQISDRVISLCGQYFGKVRDAEKEILQMIKTVTALKGILEFLHIFVNLDENRHRLPLLQSLSEPQRPLETCRRQLTEIESKLMSQGNRVGVLRAITWPWKSTDIGPFLEEIETQKTLILLALQGDSTRTTLAIENTVKDIHCHVQDAQYKKILAWLTKTNPISNHTAAREKCHPGTGEWFISSREFSYWLLPARSLWLHGIPGAGKTVLCSTIIENVKSRCPPDTACLYFYFDFNDPQKQTIVNMFYSFLAQLSSSGIPSEVRQLYERCNSGTQEATLAQLVETLHSITSHGKRMFIIIDALDESSNWKELLQGIKAIRQSKGQVNLLMTSRKELDIQAALEQTVDYVVAIQNELVDADVDNYVRECLRNDPDLSKWDDELKSEIVAALTSGACGMFRWVICQLDTLRSCLKRSAVLKALKELPKTLDETYERILLRIPEEYHHDAQIVFSLLAFSFRPISLSEAAEAVAIDLDQSSFDPRNRLRDASSILKICSSLVILSPFEPKRYGLRTPKRAVNDENKELQFAHFSVKEYLVSQRISSQSFQICSGEAHNKITKLCLIYILSFSGVLREYEALILPFFRYASQHWHVHANAIQCCNDVTTFNLMASLFHETNENNLLNSLRVWNVDSPYAFWDRKLNFAPRLYYASSLGLFELCRLLLERGADVNAQGGNYGNPLGAAARGGHDTIVRLLLERGADVNAQGGNYGNPLQAAAMGGHEGIVKLLLEGGADVNAQGGIYGHPLQADYGNPLQAAAAEGHEGIVKLLLEGGVDVNAQGGDYGNSLQAAAWGGHEGIVKLLLERGADVNAQGGDYGNALLAAAQECHEGIVKLLLERGADVNAQGGYYGNALQAATWGGHDTIVRLLLERGADVNAQGGNYGNPLQAAAMGGHEGIVKLLLERGADVNAQGGGYGNALLAAAQEGHEGIVKLLLNRGASVEDGDYGLALEGAARAGHEEFVGLLLGHRTDVKALGYALQGAAFRGHEGIVKLLLERGAGVNAQGGHCGNPLQAAAQECHEGIVKLLLERGADVNAQGGYYGNALQAATWGGHDTIVRLLLERGADVNAQGGNYGNPLQAAAWGGHEEIVKLLLERGADVNAQGGYYDNPLQAAAWEGHKKIVKLLLERGADVNAQGGRCGNPLQAAALGCHEGIVKLLLEQGADVNAQGSAAISRGCKDIETLKIAIEKDSTDSWLWNDLCDAYNAQGEYDDAIRTSIEATKQNPGKSWAWNMVGNTYMWMAKYGEAINAFKVAIKICSTDDFASATLAKAYIAKGDDQMAIDTWMKAIEKNPFASWAWDGLCNAYIVMGKHGEQESHCPLGMEWPMQCIPHISEF